MCFFDKLKGKKNNIFIFERVEEDFGGRDGFFK